MQLPETVEITVVGGGVIGLSIAYEAALKGHTVLIVEKSMPGGGATPVAAGMLAPVAEAEPTLPQMIDLGLESCRLYPDFVGHLEEDTGIDCGYRTEGTLQIALDHDHLGELEHRAAAYDEHGLAAERLSGSEVRALEPGLSPRVVGGIRTATDRQVDPRALSGALIAALEQRGVSIAAPAEVIAMHRDQSGSITGVDVGGASNDAGDTEMVRTSVVVAAAGAWTAELLPELAVLPLRPVKGQTVRLRADSPDAPMLQHVVVTPDAYLVPRRDGELVIGASTEEQGFDARPRAGITMDLLGHAWRVFPSVYEFEMREVNVGFRPALRDHMPVIGPFDEGGLFVATGHYRNGIMLAPVTAKYAVEAIETGRIPEALIPFQVTRFADDAVAEAVP